MEHNILNEGEMHAFVTVFVTLKNPQVYVQLLHKLLILVMAW